MDNALIVANIALVIITGFLVYVTRTYSYQTKRMANIMQKDYELRINPQYEIRKTIDKETNTYINGRVFIVNNGLVPIYVKNVSFQANELLNKAVKDKWILREAAMIIIKPQEEQLYHLTARVNRIASSPPPEDQLFFGKSCKILFLAQIAGPNQEYRQESRTII